MAEKLSRDEFIKFLFGSKHRLDIWSTVNDLAPEQSNPFYLFEAFHKVNESRSASKSRVLSELNDMEVLGMIQRTPVYYQRIARYERIDSPMWDLAATAMHVVEVIYPDPQI